jgi:pimeloyl-ACP methyl ester carboxylesterase
MQAAHVKTPWVLAASILLALLLIPLGATPAAASPTVPSITSIPIRVIRTSAGSVSYRSDGTGQPLILIMGYSGSQDDWAPDFVNALAVRHRVIIFDNAGIGQTTMPAGTLNISSMANQTAALITALGLKHPDVLGWSMGGMVAQALAVLHPSDVQRLVLSATYSGNGKATSPRPANAAALVSAAKTGDTDAIMALIFPANQLVAQESAYIRGVSGYPNFYQAPEALAVAQHAAISGWAAGTVEAGHGHIAAPTLIGDGADDVMTPPANVHKMVQEIHGAQFVIYPDAGHGFLFQDSSAWAARINAFLR